MKVDTSNSSKLDKIDMKILHALSRDARITITDLSQEVGLSKTPCNTRLKKLEKEGVILGYRALLDPIKMGLDHIAFVEVQLSDTRAKALAEFNEAVCKLPEVDLPHLEQSSTYVSMEAVKEDVILE